ncbi:MAG TPA: plastocyanin/azurin family copper-binding protein [Actinomycetota bacterium]|jgi:plastocyanin|nr:plastocyanin/azurin family copper-binding protein [Actinomycetota bacterium]
MVRRAFLTLVLSGIALAIPVPASAGGGGCSEVTEGTGTTVEMLYACLTPTLLRVQPGETVTFVNRDEFRHVISGSGYAWSSDGNMKPGEAFTATFRNDGVYPYQCFLHPGMAGAVIVGDATGPGAADRGGVFVAPFEVEQQPPEVVYVTRAPQPGATSTSSGSPVALVGGILVGVAVGAIVTLGVRSSAARRRMRDVTT